MPTPLFKANANGPRKLSIKAKGTTEAELTLYGQVGGDWFGDGITAKAVSDELKALDPKVSQLNIRLNSVGGDVFEGITIYNRLMQFKGKKVVYVDGLAASIASIIALAGDEIIMGDGAMFMVHLPWTFAMGNSIELSSTVDTLEALSEQMISIYSKRSGMGRGEIRNVMEQETWWDADQSIENGFATSKAGESIPIAASAMAAQWFKHAPKNYKSATTVAQSKIQELKNKIEKNIARK